MKYAWMILIGYIVSCAVWYAQFEVAGLYINHDVKIGKTVPKVECPNCKVEYKVPAADGH